MISSSTRRFNNLGSELIGHNFRNRHDLAGRKLLGVGRVVDLGGLPTGVYARYGGPLVLDFVRGNDIPAKAIYNTEPNGFISVNSYERPDDGLAVACLAQSLGGLVLEREPLDDGISASVSDAEMEFLVDFFMDPSNHSARFGWERGPDGDAICAISHQSTNLAQEGIIL